VRANESEAVFVIVELEAIQLVTRFCGFHIRHDCTGNGSVGYRVDSNTTYAVRSGAITVGGAVFNVSQAALPCPPVGISPLGQSVQPAGGSFSITITSPCGWTASSNVGWISLSANSGTGSGSLSYTVAPNNSGAARSGNIQIGTNTYSVTQLSIDCTFVVAPLSISVGVAGGQKQTGVQVNNGACPWSVQNNASWITNLAINGTRTTSSSGNGTLTFDVAANSAAQPRTATLTVAGQAVTITQAGNVCSFEVNPASINFPYSPGKGTFGVTTSLSNCPWTATSTTNWITVTSGASGSAAGTVGYSVENNLQLLPRNGAITVNTVPFNITQDACSSAPSFSPQSQAVPSVGGNFSVVVTSLCAWTASTTAPWIVLTGANASLGSGSLAYAVAANNTASTRSGVVQVNGQAFTITQSGITSPGSGILFNAESVVNGASFLSGPLSPGELFSIFGSGLGPAQAVTLETTPDGRFITTSLGGTRVLFDGVAAPLTYVSATQVNAIVPFELTSTTGTRVVVEVQGAASNPVAESVAPTSPAIFAVTGGKGQGAVLNQDSSPNSASNPAAPGSVLQVFATGFGQTGPAGVDGEIAGADPSFPILKVTATVGGIDAAVQYAGTAEGLLAGVTQVNVAIPAGVQHGDAVPLMLSVGGSASPTGTTVAIR